MMICRVFMQTVVGHYLDVEANSLEEAREKAEMEGLPSLMMLDHTYPDHGEWEATGEVLEL